MQDFSTHLVLDAMGQPCPMPLLLLKRTLKCHADQTILLKSSDPHSRQDVMRYCQIQNLKCELHAISDAEFHYVIMKHE
jgi:tRNA 2-thiouridine synthesizing protein A